MSFGVDFYHVLLTFLNKSGQRSDVLSIYYIHIDTNNSFYILYSYFIYNKHIIYENVQYLITPITSHNIKNLQKFKLKTHFFIFEASKWYSPKKKTWQALLILYRKKKNRHSNKSYATHKPDPTQKYVVALCFNTNHFM